MTRIFISYSREDRPVVHQIAPLLREVYGYTAIWFDEDLVGGQNWWDEILRQIAACDIFLYLLSEDSANSPYCQAESSEARRLQKAILPVRIKENSPIPDDLSRIQYVDLTDGINLQNFG